MNKNSEHYFHSALRLNLPVTLLPEIDGFDLKLGRRRYFFRGSVHCLNDQCSKSIANNKYCTSALLEKAGLPVPKSIFLSASDFEQGLLEEALQDLTFPVVIKPTIDGGKGLDVLCNVQTLEKLKAYLADYFPRYEFVTIEAFHGNLNSYRVLILKSKVLGVVLRMPARIVGDSQHTIRELIDLTNIERQQINDFLKPIAIDQELSIRLDELGLNLDYIPIKDESITLGYTSNASRGGTYEALGRKLCKENKRLLIRATRLLNLNLVGFDVQCAAINVPIESSGGVIIEANSAPSVRIHEEPMNGVSNRYDNVTKVILRSLIYRHPVSYIFGLFKNKRTAVYLRGITVMIFVGVIYKIVG